MRLDSHNSDSQNGDRMGEWFTILEELGKSSAIQYGRIDGTTSAPRWLERSHSQFDGIGGLLNLLESEEPGTSYPIPQQRNYAKASAGGFARIAAAQMFRGRVHPLMIGREVVTQRPSAKNWATFTNAETTKILDMAKAKGVSVNTLLLHELAQATFAHARLGEVPVRWMIPVNLRGVLNQPHVQQNHSTYLEVITRPRQTPTALHLSIQGAMNRGEHRIFWSVLSLLSGRSWTWRKRFLQKQMHILTGCLGAFSNLGNWNSNDGSPDCGGHWLFCPPVALCQPIGAGCVTWRGRMALMVQVDSSISQHDDLASELIRGWVSKLRN